jgi:imidazolonepropionase-like amidohydrolase
MKTVVLTLLAFNLTCIGYCSDEIPAGNQQTPIAIMNVDIHPVSSDPIENGTLLFENGKLTGIGKQVKLSKETQKIDGKGKHLYPGLIDAATILGLVEVNSIRATIDYSETGMLNPNVRSWVAFNPDSEIIPVTRSNGILLSLVMPQGGLISGRSALMQLDGWTWEDMALKTDVGLHIQWPKPSLSSSSTTASDEPRPTRTSVKELRDFFEKARDYRNAKESGSFTQTDLRMESMLSVLDGTIPLFVHANELASIQSAVAFSVEQHLRIVIVGGYDAPHCAQLLRTAKIPVIVTGTYRLPERSDDPYDDAYTVPDRLRKAKVQYCLASLGRFGATGIRNLPYHAATAVAYGLPREEALKATTLYAAEILGAADCVGSLELGKDATFILTNGDPLEATTVIDQAFIQGRAVDLNNRHKRLFRKYQSKYEDDGTGTVAPK